MVADFDAETATRAGLLPDERVLWHSRPGAGRLFLSVVPRLIRDVVFLSVIGFSLYAGGWQEATPTSRIACALLVPFLVWLLFINLREGTGARVSHYLLTDRRLILMTPRAWSPRFTVLPRKPSDIEKAHHSFWFDGEPQRGSITNGRATIRVRYEGYMAKSTVNYPEKAYRSRTLRLYAVDDPDQAIAMIVQIRREALHAG